MNIVHTYIGDLQVQLIAPDGTAYTLKAYSTGGSTDNINTTYSVNASSEVANGVWKLRVSDNAAQDVGRGLQQLTQGNGVTISGRAHIERRAAGTFIEIENPNLPFRVAGFVPFGNQSGFPGLYNLDGRDVERLEWLRTAGAVLDARPSTPYLEMGKR